MWPALINGQPFYFSDTSSYVRAGDVIAHIIGGPSARTLWTRPDPDAQTPTAASAASEKTSGLRPAARGNDPDSGYIMAGRSPYFGIVLWLGWLSSRFWLFVLLQAAIAYFLIGAALRCFGLDRPGLKLTAVALLSLLSPLALYNGVLLADALSGFGCVAFLILLAPRVLFARWEILLLALVLIASVVSHLTHLVILAGMVAVLGALIGTGWVARREASRAMLIGMAAVVTGVASIAATSVAVKAHFGQAPVLVPLITARFIADGPGRDYIEAGCGGRAFAVCRIPYRAWTSSTVFLWSTEPATGAFLLADSDMRRAMSIEDKAFAVAVARAYPVRTLRVAVWNSLLQLTDLRVDIVQEVCFATPACIGKQFPDEIVREIAATPAGRGAWPLAAMNIVIYASVALSLVALMMLLPGLRASAPAAARLICLWLLLLALAMAINGFLGGAISEPQSRYQTRMIWPLPLLAIIALFVARLRPSDAPEGAAS
ncbi:hypothetical protein [Sphingomonas natans]|nr:hypothetical protein [Sphingomonas sp. BIUV-7]